MDFVKAVEKWKEKKDALIEFQKENISETDTRCKIIDPILLEVMGWEEQLIKREPKIEAGYIDYFCSSEKNKYVIEAKRTNVEFRFPKGRKLLNSKSISQSFKELKDAIEQARGYAKEKDTPFCIISNGLNFVFTKTYASEDENDTYILQGEEAIEKNLANIYEVMSPYKNGYKFFNDILNSKGNIRSEPQYKESINDEYYSKTSVAELNNFAVQIRPYLDYFFSDLTDDNVTSEELNYLYCDTNKLEGYSAEMKKYLRGRVPFYGWPVKAIETENTTAGEFSQDYKLSFQQSSGEVFILVGNIGAGKTTFLHRFYKYIIDEHTREHLIWINIDFSKYFPNQGDPVNFIYEQITEVVREKYSELALEEWDTLLKIYEKEINIKKKGIWKPFVDKEDKLNEKISTLIEKELENQENHLKKVIGFLKTKGYEICLIFDNLDHQPSEVQEKISYYAVSQAKNYNCIMILSLRDESFWEMRSRRPMDAFGNIKVYQIIPPDVHKMLQKRLTMVKSQIKNEVINYDIGKKAYNIKIKDIFIVLENTVNDLEVRELFERLSSGNMRNALEIFRLFATSGHTKLPKVLVTNSQKVFPHEVLRSIGLSNYKNYSSDNSKIMNLFRFYTDGFYSHFVSIRILEILIDKEDSQNADIGSGYISIEELYESLTPYCMDIQALRKCIMPLLQCYLIDSDIGSRKFGEQNYHDKIKYVKITPAGKYYNSVMISKFEYLEMVLSDTQIKDREYFDLINDKMNILRRKQMKINKLMETRFELVEIFLEYLKKEEERDLLYQETSESMQKFGRIMPRVVSGYQANKQALKKMLNI